MPSAWGLAFQVQVDAYFLPILINQTMRCDEELHYEFRRLDPCLSYATPETLGWWLKLKSMCEEPSSAMVEDSRRGDADCTWETADSWFSDFLRECGAEQECSRSCRTQTDEYEYCYKAHQPFVLETGMRDEIIRGIVARCNPERSCSSSVRFLGSRAAPL